MRKVMMSIAELVPKMMIAENIFNDYGAIVVAEKTVLDGNIIQRLDSLGIDKIKIYEEDNIITANSKQLFKAQYKENTENIKDVLHDITNGKNVNLDKISVVSESLFVRLNANMDIISSLSDMRNMDEYTHAHLLNVSLVSMLIGKWMKFDEDKIKDLLKAGLLHDIGKMKIDEIILNKPGKLTTLEFEEIKKHPVYGYRMLESMNDVSKDIMLGVLMHHERGDGSGYPIGTKSDNIHIYAKIIAVADVFDAMTSNTAYHRKMTPFNVFEYLESSSLGLLDHAVTATFLKNIAAYYIGDKVMLSDGKVGEIIHIDDRYVSRPLIKVGSDFIDLNKSRDLKIVEIF